MSISRKDQYEIEQLRENWYGFQEASDERAGGRPLRRAGDVFSDCLPGIIGKTAGEIMTLQTVWAEIAGKINASHSRPVFYKEGEIVIEISHPAFKIALDTPLFRNLILRKIPELTGLACSAIRFVPAGRQKNSPFSSRKS